MDIYRLMQEFLCGRCAIFTIRYIMIYMQKEFTVVVHDDGGIRSYPLPNKRWETNHLTINRIELGGL